MSARGRGGHRGKGKGRAPDPSAAKLAQDAAHFDELLVRALKTITSFLPSPSSCEAQTFDLLPHDSLLPLLSTSQLPELLGSLLRNDSVTEWTVRSEVYYAMLEMLRRLADCEVTFPVLIDRQWAKKESCGLEAWMWNEGEIVWETTTTTTTTANGQQHQHQQTVHSRSLPLYTHFKKLTRQCEAFMAGAARLMEGPEGKPDAEFEQTMTLCGDIIATKDDIERAMKVVGRHPDTFDMDDEPPAHSSVSQTIGTSGDPHPTKGPVTRSQAKGKAKAAPPPEPELVCVDERLYTRECERLAFQYVTLGEESKTSANASTNGNGKAVAVGGDGAGLVYKTFNYASKLKQTESKTRIPKDRLHLVKELAVMATSLPPGVWVRVDEVRNDAM